MTEQGKWSQPGDVKCAYCGGVCTGDREIQTQTKENQMLENPNPVSTQLSYEECRELHGALIEASMVLPVSAPHRVLIDSPEYAAFEAKAKAAYVEAVNESVRRSGFVRVPRQ